MISMTSKRHDNLVDLGNDDKSLKKATKKKKCLHNDWILQEHGALIIYDQSLPVL